MAIDDHSRLAYAEVLSRRERPPAPSPFCAARSPGSPSDGVRVERVMTDNGSAYVSHAARQRCRELGLRHLRTRPYRPRTNGKAERFIQTLLNEWAYGRIYGSPARTRTPPSSPACCATTSQTPTRPPSTTTRPPHD